MKRFARGFFPAIQRTAFYGITALILSFILYDINFSMVFKRGFSPNSLSNSFYGYMFWSLIAFPIITIIYIICRKYLGLYSDILHYNRYSFLALVVRDIVTILIIPFIFTGMLFDTIIKKKDVFGFSDVLDLVIFLVNIIYIIVAFAIAF